MDQHGGLPLDPFTTATPPGWRPGITHYPFRRFKERLELWCHSTDKPVSQQGPALAGRLSGRPFNLAMALQLETNAGALAGTDALAYPGEDAQLDHRLLGLLELLRRLRHRRQPHPPLHHRPPPTLTHPHVSPKRATCVSLPTISPVHAPSATPRTRTPTQNKIVCPGA